MNAIDWLKIEERIRPHVKFLRDVGYETTGSCGHDMWVSIACRAREIGALEATLRAAGYLDFSLTSRTCEGRFLGVTLKFEGRLAGDGKPFDFILMKVEPDSHPLYFVVRFPRWADQDNIPEDDEYYFDEHTCPTNWTKYIIGVISAGDEDPHGFATFVRRLPEPEGMDEDGVSWSELFPEVCV